MQIPIPSAEDPKLAPDIAGYVTPDLETWSQQVQEMENMKEEMFYAIWGTYLVDNRNVEKTATEAYINAQPIIDKLHPIADLAERIETDIANAMASIMYNVETQVDIKYGRRWLIETPDMLWERYIDAKKEQAPITTLDYLYQQFLMAEYHNDVVMLNMKLKEFHVEPYVHYSLSQIQGTASKQQLQAKLLFSEWTSTLSPEDYDKDIDQLKEEFNNYVINNAQIDQESPQE